MDLRYALSEIRKHGLDRTWWRRRFLTHVVSRYYDVVGGSEGTSILDADWDNCIILDACRYDLFEEVRADYPLPGTLSQRTSLDSATPGFLEKTFQDDTFHDIVYVNANPYVRMLLDPAQFHAVVDVWEDDWDDQHNTVFPEVMAKRALEAAECYPDKRLLVHFIQPHYPFVGEDSLGERDVFSIREQALGNEDAVQRNPTPFELLERGTVTRQEVWAAYRSNLELAMPSVEKLLSELGGKSVVTADHGNAIGEWARPFPIRVYGHPVGIQIPALTSVPWLVHETGQRREIVSEASEMDRREVSADTQERLRKLGYAE